MYSELLSIERDQAWLSSFVKHAYAWYYSIFLDEDIIEKGLIKEFTYTEECDMHLLFFVNTNES